MSGALVAALLSVACQRAPQPPASIEEQMAVEPGQAVVVKLHTGSIAIRGAAGDQLTVAGEIVPGRASFALTPSATEIQLTVEERRRTFAAPAQPPTLTVQVPNGVPIRIETFDASVTITGYTGTVDIDSTAGNIVADDLGGTIALRSRRGHITLRNSDGEVRVLGEAGQLSLEAVGGQVGSSTIMGTIRFVGQPSPGDQIRLESDHGPIEVELGQQSDVAVQVNTNSGRIDCAADGLVQTSSSCTGRLGPGMGRLTVRTVSGNVTLRLQPP
jgi:hypothetical protein